MQRSETLLITLRMTYQAVFCPIRLYLRDASLNVRIPKGIIGAACADIDCTVRQHKQRRNERIMTCAV